MGHRQPMMHQHAQRGQDVAGPVVQPTGTDGRRQLSFVGDAERGQRFADLGGRLGAQFALDFCDMGSTRFSPVLDAIKKIHISAADKIAAAKAG